MNIEKYKRRYKSELEAVIALATAELANIESKTCVVSGLLKAALGDAIAANVRFDTALEMLDDEFRIAGVRAAAAKGAQS